MVFALKTNKFTPNTSLPMKNVNSVKYTCKTHNENMVGTVIFNLVRQLLKTLYVIFSHSEKNEKYCLSDNSLCIK